MEKKPEKERMKRDGGRQNWVAALAANTASYLLLLAQRVAVS